MTYNKILWWRQKNCPGSRVSVVLRKPTHGPWVMQIHNNGFSTVLGRVTNGAELANVKGSGCLCDSSGTSKPEEKRILLNGFRSHLACKIVTVLKKRQAFVFERFFDENSSETLRSKDK